MSHDSGNHEECIILERRRDWTRGLVVTGEQMPSRAAALCWIVEDARRGIGSPAVQVDGDLIKFVLDNGTWIYRIGERVTTDDEDYYILRWVD